MCDIDFSLYGPMFPIGYNPGGVETYWYDYIFTGTYDGQGYKIKNWQNVPTIADILTADDYPIWAAGLFARVNGTIKNVVMENCSVKSLTNPPKNIWGNTVWFPIDYSIGSLVGILHGGEVSKCSSSGVVRTLEEYHDSWITSIYPWAWGSANGGVRRLLVGQVETLDDIVIEECFSKMRDNSAIYVYYSY